MRIAPLLGIRPGITALMGGGGKTTLMVCLAEELRDRGTVILCTSTKIRIPTKYPLLTGADPAAVRAALIRDGAVCVGSPCGDGKLQASPIPFPALASLAEYVIVEADGSKGLPLKAHASHEPVIPENAGRVVLVLGADGFGRPIRDVCHRPEIFGTLAGVPEDTAVTPGLAARVIAAEGWGNCVYVNKAEDPAARAAARDLADCLSMPVIAGSLHRREYECLS